MSLPLDIEQAARACAAKPGASLPRIKLALARLVLGQAPPSAINQLEVAERYLNGHATSEELADARQDAWTYIGSLACYCSVTDSASAQAVLSCLVPDSDEDAGALLEQCERVARCGVPSAAILAALHAA